MGLVLAVRVGGRRLAEVFLVHSQHCLMNSPTVITLNNKGLLAGDAQVLGPYSGNTDLSQCCQAQVLTESLLSHPTNPRLEDMGGRLTAPGLKPLSALTTQGDLGLSPSQ